MTRLRRGNGTRRETAWRYRGRPLVVELHPQYMTLRLKGTRMRYPLHYDSTWHRALEIEGRRQIEECLRRRAKSSAKSCPAPRPRS